MSTHRFSFPFGFPGFLFTASGAFALALVAAGSLSATGCDSSGPTPPAIVARVTAQARSEADAPPTIPDAFAAIAPIFLRHKIPARAKNLLWERYRDRWVRWTGSIVSFTDNGITVRMSPDAITFDVSLGVEGWARDRLKAYRVGQSVAFTGRLSSFDDIFGTFYLVHGDVMPAPGPNPAVPAIP